MSTEPAMLAYVLRLADNALVLSQRMIENVAAYPELEEELANANFALDYIGQARMLYSYAAEMEGAGRSEDDLAYLRDENEFQNLLMLELPNGHFGDAVVRQFLFETFYLHLLIALQDCDDQGLSDIAARATKEVTYHLRHTAQWLIRLGDGTELSHRRVQESLAEVWRYTGEMFAADELDDCILREHGGPDLAVIADMWRKDVQKTLAEATLSMPDEQWMAGGGKRGQHTEHLGYLLAEMQYLQRSHPGVTW